jgi:hypothetical protein
VGRGNPLCATLPLGRRPNAGNLGRPGCSDCSNGRKGTQRTKMTDVAFKPRALPVVRLSQRESWRKLDELRPIAKLASAFLLAWLFAAPAMACLLPIAQLTPEEKACCRNMGGMCDDMAKNTSHSCCAKVQAHSPSFVIARGVSSHVRVFSAIPLSFPHATATTLTGAPESMPAEYGYPPGHSPPTLPELTAFRI